MWKEEPSNRKSSNQEPRGLASLPETLPTSWLCNPDELLIFICFQSPSLQSFPFAHHPSPSYLSWKQINHLISALKPPLSPEQSPNPLAGKQDLFSISQDWWSFIMSLLLLLPGSHSSNQALLCLCFSHTLSPRSAMTFSNSFHLVNSFLFIF